MRGGGRKNQKEGKEAHLADRGEGKEKGENIRVGKKRGNTNHTKFFLTITDLGLERGERKERRE